MMLAKETKTIPKGDWIWEIKYDGIRAWIRKRREEVEICNRSGHDISHQFPELVEEALRIKGSFLIDGEIVAWNNGISDFEKVSKRTHLKDKLKIKMRSQREPVTFMAFDILDLNGEYLESDPLCLRKDKLIKLFVYNPIQINRITSVIFYCDKINKHLARLKSMKVEGVMFKDPYGIYIRDIRSNYWLKYKFIKEIDTIVRKIENNPAGVKCYCDENIEVQVSGFQARSIKIGMLLTVNYLNKTKSGKFRMPTFKKIVEVN